MKKTIFKISLCVVCFTAICFLGKQKNNKISELVLCNVEALAENESYIHVYCYGDGSVDCYGRNVEMKIEGYSL